MKQPKNKIEYLYGIIEDCVESLEEHHAVFEHSYKTDEELKTRCAVEKTAGASCFNKGVDVAEKIADIIYDSVEILPWLKSTVNDPLRIVVEEEACGKKFLKDKKHNWDEGALICNKVVLLLGKEVDKYNCLVRMYVITCYAE